MRLVSCAAKLPALSDDSGLEVEARATTRGVASNRRLIAAEELQIRQQLTRIGVAIFGALRQQAINQRLHFIWHIVHVTA